MVAPRRELKGGVSGAAFLLGNVLCWAAIPVLLRHLTGSMDAWVANGIRYPLAAILYWPFLFVAWRTGKLDARVLNLCIVPAALTFVAQIFWALAPYYLPASAIGFFVRFSLVSSLAGAMVLFPDERKLLSLPAFYVGLTLAVVGFLVLSASKLKFDVEVTGTGIGIMLLCSVLFGLYGVSVRYFLHGIHPLVSFGVVSHFVSIGTITAMCWAGNPRTLASLSGQNWLLLVVSSILGIALGHFFLYSSVARLGAAVASGAQTLSPFLTLFMAWLFLGESLSLLEWCAGITMVAGAALLLLAQQRLVSRAKHDGTNEMTGS